MTNRNSECRESPVACSYNSRLALGIASALSSSVGRAATAQSLSLELSLGTLNRAMTAPPPVMVSHAIPGVRIPNSSHLEAVGRVKSHESSDSGKEAVEAACQLRDISANGLLERHASDTGTAESNDLALNEGLPAPDLARVKREASSEPPEDMTPDQLRDKRPAPSAVGEGPGMAIAASPPIDDGNTSLREADPDVWRVIEQEKERQFCGIELIASENFVSQSVMEALGSVVCNKYSEGQPGARYYGGNQHIDALESLCKERALSAFRLDPEEWGVNVQPYSCTSANLAVFAGLLNSPKDRIMGLDLPSGGHMSHGYYTSSGKKVAAASVFFETLPYKVNPITGLMDYDKMEEKAMEYRPKLLVCGGSSYPRVWDFARCRQIADRCGAVLMCDMAHISGLVAAQEHPSPFEYADIVTSTTHKTMRGPRGGIVFFRRGPVVNPHQRRSGGNCVRASSPGPGPVAMYDYEDRINFAVFPMMQGGPHNNHTAALAVSLKQVGSPEYAKYMGQVKRNSAALASALMKRGCRLVTGGTDNHLLVWDLRPLGVTGQRFEKVCELCGISLNKCPIYGDALSPPGGVRVGTPALTTRGCKEPHMEVVAEILVRAAQITQRAIMEQHQLKHQQQQHVSQRPSNLDPGQVKQEGQAGAPQGGSPRHVKPDSIPGTTVGAAASPAGASSTADVASALPPAVRVKRPRLSDWVEQLGKSEEVKELRLAVHEFALGLPMPGFGRGYRPGGC